VYSKLIFNFAILSIVITFSLFFISSYNFNQGNFNFPIEEVTTTIINATVTYTSDLNWEGNHTNMLNDCLAGNYSYGIFSNGTWKCRNDEQGGGGNTTEEIWFVVNNGTFMSATTKVGNTTLEIWGVVDNNTFMPIGTKTGNTTVEIWGVVDNGTFDRYKGYYNSSLINSTELEEQTGGILGIKLSWLTSFITSIVNSLIGTHESTFKHGNTTAEIEALDSFNTTLEMETAVNQSGAYYGINVNSSNYWDNLNSPADILGSQINNDLDWVNSTYGISTYGKSYYWNLTTTTYDGNDLGNYSNGKNVCDTAYPGTHWCTVEEMILTSQFKNVSAILNWSGTFWIIGGPPGYLANANDCLSWTSSAVTSYGRFWDLSALTKATSPEGQGWLTACNQIKALGCCKPW